MFKMDCQKTVTCNIRHEKRAIKNKANKNKEKKLEQRLVQGVNITPITISHEE